MSLLGAAALDVLREDEEDAVDELSPSADKSNKPSECKEYKREADPDDGLRRPPPGAKRRSRATMIASKPGQVLLPNAGLAGSSLQARESPNNMHPLLGLLATDGSSLGGCSAGMGGSGDTGGGSSGGFSGTFTPEPQSPTILASIAALPSPAPTSLSPSCYNGGSGGSGGLGDCGGSGGTGGFNVPSTLNLGAESTATRTGSRIAQQSRAAGGAASDARGRAIKKPPVAASTGSMPGTDTTTASDRKSIHAGLSGSTGASLSPDLAPRMTKQARRRKSGSSDDQALTAAAAPSPSPSLLADPRGDGHGVSSTRPGLGSTESLETPRTSRARRQLEEARLLAASLSPNDEA